MTYQTEKQLVRDFYHALDSAPFGDIAGILAQYCAPDLLWRGFYPFDELHGPEAVANTFWGPLHKALSHLQRRDDIFMAGANEMDGFASTWVVSMGHLMGLFDAPWLGIAPTGKMAFLRYCAFNRVDNGRITETAMYFDIPHLMMQAGFAPFPKQTAAFLVQPGPMTHDGLLFEHQPVEEGHKTLAAINAMITDLGQWNSGISLEEELRRTWNEDMIWWGP
ncbi:MAG: ester cyclase, partial [Arenibacterium sp.]